MEGNQIDNVLRMAQAIDQYGALVVIMAVFMVIATAAVFLIFSLYKKNEKGKDSDYKKMFTTREQQQQEVFAEMMKTVFSATKSGQLRELSHENTANTDTVRERLKTVIAFTKADRVSVYEFFGGRRPKKGQAPEKLSCWAEYAMLQRYVRKDKHKGIPIPNALSAYKALTEKHHWEALAKKDVSAGLGEWSKDLEASSAFAQAVYSAEGVLIGFVLIEYIMSVAEPRWVEQAKIEVRRLADRVSIVMDMELK